MLSFIKDMEYIEAEIERRVKGELETKIQRRVKKALLQN
jgi:hypothetical protein